MDENFTIDVHTHVQPDFYNQALVDAGYGVEKDGRVFVDGFQVSAFDIETYLASRARHGYNYSLLSITAPGVSFLKDKKQAKQLARKLNDQMYEWTQEHPRTLGALCVLPLPDVEASLQELRYCLDQLHFDGVGLSTNYDGIYLGNPKFDLLFDELNKRRVTALVHPTAPIPETKVAPNISTPVMEYTFDTTRAIASLLFTQSRKRYPDVNLIFSHGGGVLPFLAQRLALQTRRPFHGGLDPDESYAELQGYYYDLAVTWSEPQLAALNAFVRPDKLLIGSDYPYLTEDYLPGNQEAIASYTGFSPQDLKKIRHENALALFPRIRAKLESDKKQ